MKVRARASLAAVLLLAACVSLPDLGGDDDHDDGDKDRPKAEERAKKYCVDQARARGLRVEDVGRIEKVAKKQYEVKLRVASKNKQLKNEKNQQKDKDDDARVLCRYDDKGRQATLYN